MFSYAISKVMRPGVCVLVIMAGLAILAWPEGDIVMMVQLSPSHGPSIPDLIGLGILLSGYIPLATRIVTDRVHLRNRLKGFYIGSVIFTLCGFGGIVLGLYLDFDWLLWIAVTVASVAQAYLIYNSFLRAV